MMEFITGTAAFGLLVLYDYYQEYMLQYMLLTYNLLL